MQLFNKHHGKQCCDEFIHENKKQQAGVFCCAILSVTYGGELICRVLFLVF